MPRVLKHHNSDRSKKRSDAAATTRVPTDGRGSPWVVAVAPPVLIGIAIFLAYSNAMLGQFLFDDRSSIVENKSIRRLWPLSSSMWAPPDLPTSGRPLVNFSFALNYAAGQSDVFGYHLVNVLLHCINAALLYALLYWTIVRSSWNGVWVNNAAGFAFFAALLWSLHPMQTEAVSYITQRTELMMAMFFLATLYTSRRAWDASTRNAALAWQGLSIVACGLGMLCKEVMVVAPVMVVLYDMTFLEGSRLSILKRRWVFYLGLFATWSVLVALLSTAPRERSAGLNLGVHPLDYLAFQFWAIVRYLWLALWPAKLTGDYGEFVSFPIGMWLPSFIVIVVLVALIMWAWFRARPLSFLGCWIFLILAPTSSIVPIATEPMAERRMYLPLAAMITLMAFAAVKLALAWRLTRHSNDPVLGANRRIALGLLGILMAVIYGAATYSRNQVFRSELVFWSDVTQKLPGSSRAFCNLGVASMNENQLELAYASLQQALKLEPNSSEALSGLGKWYADRGAFAEAIDSYNKAIAIDPELSTAFFNRGLVFLRKNQLDEAILSFENAVRIDPSVPNTFVTLGSALFMKERYDEAIENFRIAAQLDTTSSDAFANLGAALVRKGQYQQAVEMCQKALEIEPMKSSAFHNMGDALAALDRNAEAINAYTRCLAITPNDVYTWKKLGKLHAASKHRNEARQCFERVLQLEPGSPEAIKELQQLGTQ